MAQRAHDIKEIAKFLLRLRRESFFMRYIAWKLGCSTSENPCVLGLQDKSVQAMHRKTSLNNLQRVPTMFNRKICYCYPIRYIDYNEKMKKIKKMKLAYADCSNHVWMQHTEI